MDYSPHDFVKYAGEKDLKRLEKFKHRTFNGGDALCFLSFFRWYYSQHNSLEDAFLIPDTEDMTLGINRFQHLFRNNPDFLPRTGKHVAAPHKNASCKRINMFLRWMVRNDEQGVDFGVWKRLHPRQLMIPLDVHVQRVALSLGILERDKPDWKAVVELTQVLRGYDSEDPVKYDFALFGMGVAEKF